MMTVEYRPRLVDPLVTELLAELPAVSLLGPRASGKTTTALRHAATVVRLDRPEETIAFRGDPDAALRAMPEPVLLDEWQEVPEVLGAVKRAVDNDARPGRFVLTGSVRANLDAVSWPGTGRVVDVPMTTLTVRERIGDASDAPFLDRVVEGEPLPTVVDGFDLTDYVEIAALGGFPEPVLRLSARARRRWLDGYLDQLTLRDAPHVAPGRDPQRLRRFLAAYAHCTAGIVTERTLSDAAGIDPKTVAGYERMLADLFIVHPVPAWTSNRLKRLTTRPKRYVTDSALVGALLRVGERGILRDGDVLGRLIDTFVVAQLRAELPVSDRYPTMYHVRNSDGREIDLLIEYGDGRLVGIEVKAKAAAQRNDARHLAWLRDALGDRFIAGLVLHTGRRTYPLGDRIQATPIAAIWSRRG